MTVLATTDHKIWWQTRCTNGLLCIGDKLYCVVADHTYWSVHFDDMKYTHRTVILETEQTFRWQTIHLASGLWCQNDVALTSLWGHHTASTLIQYHFYIMCPLDSERIYIMVTKLVTDCTNQQQIIQNSFIIRRYCVLPEWMVCHHFVRSVTSIYMICHQNVQQLLSSVGIMLPKCMVSHQFVSLS